MKHPARGSARHERMRQQLAQEAARIMAEEGVSSFAIAKHKAAQRLHAEDTHNLPRNDEIRTALTDYLRLFKADSQPRHLHRLRAIACRLLQQFARFEPRLTGAVLDGTAGEFSGITLHLFAEPVERVRLFLLDEAIRHEIGNQRLSLANGTMVDIPAFKIEAEDVPVSLLVFDLNGQREAPRDPATGRPMQRANLATVRALLANAD